MRFEWDHAKARTNIVKHGVSFEAATAVWDDPLHVVVPDRIEAGEQRWHALGMVGAVAILVVVHTYPGPDDAIRMTIVSSASSGPGVRRSMRGGAMSRTALSAEELARLAALAARPDHEIDTDDIPEAPAENWRHARRGPGRSPVERPAIIPIDGDVVSWFKRQSSDDGYQADINRVLRRYVDEAAKRSA